MRRLVCRILGHKINRYLAARAVNTPVAVGCARCHEMVPFP